MQIYAIIKSGRREYRVFPGKVVKIERMEAEPGEIVEFDQVSKLVNGDQVATGQPLVKGALVRAQVVKHGQEKGIIVFRMKRRRIYQDKFDRQREFTSLKVLEIVSGDAVFGKQEADPRKRKRAIASEKAAELKKAKAANRPVPEPNPGTVRPSVENDEPERITPSRVTAPVVTQEPVPEPDTTPAPPTPISQDTVDKTQKNPETRNSRKWSVLALIIIVVLLALVALFRDQPDSSQSPESPVPNIETPAEILLRQTGEVDKPSAPAAPPK